MEPTIDQAAPVIVLTSSRVSAVGGISSAKTVLATNREAANIQIATFQGGEWTKYLSIVASMVSGLGCKAKIIGFNDAVVNASALKIRFLLTENLNYAFIPGVVQYQKLTNVTLCG